MDVLQIIGTDESPNVLLDKENGKFEFSGKSLPEDVKAFYAPIIDWLKEYATCPNDETLVNFKMDYFNSASAKQILDILTHFEKVHKQGKQVLVRWYYLEDDEDMQDAGLSYQGIVDVPLENIAY